MILDRIAERATYEKLHPLFKEAFDFLETVTEKETGRHELSGGMYVLVNPKNTTKPLGDIKFEAHRKYLDLQYVVSGNPVLTWAPISDLIPDGDYMPDRDLIFFSGEGTTIALNPGDFFIVYPNDGHKPNGHFETAGEYQVVVVKIPVEA
ncbi:MAG: YhcH/YjgK/YiaL family protein [Clostridia bacterium]|nr:YhcH/YjgK/YiaL family protein [Clostridia bacterium]